MKHSIYLVGEDGNRVSAGWTEVRFAFEAKVMFGFEGRVTTIQLQAPDGSFSSWHLTEEIGDLQPGDSIACTVELDGWRCD